MKTREERFKEEYVPWVLKHKKYPSTISEDKIEKSLGIWRRDCREKKFKPLLDFDKEVNFDSPISPEKRFEEEYKPWVLKHKKYPNQRSNDKIERFLGQWRSRQKIKNFKPLLDFDKEVNFNESRNSPEKRFKKEYVPWVLEHEKYPKQISDDETERFLGAWRNRQRVKKFKPLLDFDKEFNFYSYKPRKSQEERFEEYKSWALEHEKYPSLYSDDRIEKSLGVWRSRQRNKNFKPLLDFDKEVNFDSRKSRKSPEERFIKEYIPWVLKYKKYPSQTSKNEIEKSLGNWRYKQRFENFEQLKNFDIFYSNYLIGNKKAIEIFNKLKEKGVI